MTLFNFSLIHAVPQMYSIPIEDVNINDSSAKHHLILDGVAFGGFFSELQHNHLNNYPGH